MKKGILAFIAGAVVGSVATWYITKTRYEHIIDIEIESVKSVFLNRSKPLVDDVTVMDPISNKKSNDFKEYASIVSEVNYTGYSDENPKQDIKEEVKSVSNPYIITPEEFRDDDEYASVSLSYYADEHLTDDEDELVDDIENTVGYDSLKHFGEYEEDSVYVRNDDMKCNFEILLDEQYYSDVINVKRSKQNS